MQASIVPTFEILKYLNPVFSVLGGEPIAELPKGIQEDEADCPIARAFRQATGRSVDVRLNSLDVFFCDDACEIARMWTGRPLAFESMCNYDGIEIYAIALPQVLQDFIEAFDGGAYPELIDGVWEGVRPLGIERGPLAVGGLDDHLGIGIDGGTRGAPILSLVGGSEVAEGA